MIGSPKQHNRLGQWRGQWRHAAATAGKFTGRMMFPSVKGPGSTPAVRGHGGNDDARRGTPGCSILRAEVRLQIETLKDEQK